MHKHTRRSQWRRRIYKRLPEWMKKHDFEVFVSFLGILSGIPLLLGKVQPTSVNALLPKAVVYTWGAVLLVGCICVLTGIIQATKLAFPRRATWMRVEAFGLTALAYYCYLYAVCILGFNFSGGWSAAMIILAFGGTCHVREAAIHIEIEQYRLTLGLQERA